ncbi:hypothetical protein BDN70DRAFT_888582 [Pholiota conissans]|uniref:Uncharacterized protein n=1 Tax=Pholiota conissans TaxID=109636 RepID=A0A9P5YLF0_9AGAR|nr:hypothetical protein BDN70DRAFT_888582 [Pholiota conissans]
MFGGCAASSAAAAYAHVVEEGTSYTTYHCICWKMAPWTSTGTRRPNLVLYRVCTEDSMS